ncbi:MAG: DMT family transporter [Pseudomonadota bacterium]|nr:DMT family transporter [Pseudomonadota bacterium]
MTPLRYIDPHQMQNPRWLFWTPTLIWASTWHVILYQLAETPALTAVAWRFALAASLLAAVAVNRRQSLRVPWRVHGWMVLTGALQYGLNYCSVYVAEQTIPSGLVAVLFSLMVFFNALAGSLLFGRPLTLRFSLCALLGVAGVVAIFWPEVLAASARPLASVGLGWGLLAVACACTGNVLTLKLTARGLKLVPVLAWCMGYGALSLVLVAGVSGVSLAPGHSGAWWASLVYLAGFGTVLAFLAYFRLSQMEGPGRAALTSVVIPVIALAVSAALEGWRPQTLSYLGGMLCLGSVWWATRPAAVSGL